MIKNVKYISKDEKNYIFIDIAIWHFVTNKLIF